MLRLAYCRDWMVGRTISISCVRVRLVGRECVRVSIRTAVGECPTISHPDGTHSSTSSSSSGGGSDRLGLWWLAYLDRHPWGRSKVTGSISHGHFFLDWEHRENHSHHTLASSSLSRSEAQAEAFLRQNAQPNTNLEMDAREGARTVAKIRNKGREKPEAGWVTVGSLVYSCVGRRRKRIPRCFTSPALPALPALPGRLSGNRPWAVWGLTGNLDESASRKSVWGKGTSFSHCQPVSGLPPRCSFPC